jgi:hypothetical protein
MSSGSLHREDELQTIRILTFKILSADYADWERPREGTGAPGIHLRDSSSSSWPGGMLMSSSSAISTTIPIRRVCGSGQPGSPWMDSASRTWMPGRPRTLPTLAPPSPANPLARAGQMPLELGRRIDYIMIRSGIHGPTLAVADCQRVLDEPVNGVWASDHFGVMAELEVPAHVPGTWS